MNSEPRHINLRNCKNVIAPLYASVLGQPRHIRRVKNTILHLCLSNHLYWMLICKKLQLF